MKQLKIKKANQKIGFFIFFRVGDNQLSLWALKIS